MNAMIMSVGLRELMLVQEQAAKPIAIAQLEFGVHFNRLERAHLDTNLAAHANREVDVENGGIQLHLPLIIRFLILALDDVNALGRAFFLADLARDAAQSLLRSIAIVDEKRKLPGRLRQHLSFFGILECGQPFLRHITAEEILRRDPHPFNDLFA